MDANPKRFKVKTYKIVKNRKLILKNGVKRMIMEVLHWTISLGIWVGIATLVASIIWTLRQLKQSGGKK